jgi:hypothetical protein
VSLQFVYFSFSFFNMIRYMPTVDGEIFSIAEESMKACLESAITSMKNLENVK